MQAPAKPPQWRVVNGKIYNANQWLDAYGLQSQGKVIHVEDGGLVVGVGYMYESGRFFLKNYVDHSGKGIAEGDLIWFAAMRTGVTNDAYGETLELSDCGIPTNTPPPEVIAAAQARAVAEAKMRQAAKEKTRQAQVRAFMWLQSQVTNNDASAEFDLGDHYLNGDGCETNRQLAIEWFKKAAAQGSLEASNKLARISKP
jgi:TPR repeat protein